MTSAAPVRPDGAIRRVYVTRRIPGWALRRLRAEGLDVDSWPSNAPVPRERLLGAVAGADALVCMGNPGRSQLGVHRGGYDAIDAQLLDAAPRLRLVVAIGGETNHIDHAACARRGVLVANTPAWTIDSVADHAFALLLAVAMRVTEGLEYVRAGRWRHWSPYRLPGHDVHGRTLGIVGLGAIGACVARRALGFGMTVVYADPVRRRDLEAVLGVRHASLDALIRRADHVSLHVPPADSTRHLVDRTFLHSMRRSAILVNTSRGEVVDTDALVEALAARRIAGAALDVVEPDPLPATHPLLGFPNVIVTPHLGASTVSTRRAMTRMAVDNLLAAARGEPPPGLIRPGDDPERPR